MNTSSRSVPNTQAPSWRSLRVTIAAVWIVIASLLFLPSILLESFQRDPLASLILFVFYVVFKYRLWKQHAGVINVTILYYAISCFQSIMAIEKRYFSFHSNTKSMRKVMNRQFLRSAVIFALVEMCVYARRPYIWAGTIAAYTFSHELLDMIFARWFVPHQPVVTMSNGNHNAVVERNHRTIVDTNANHQPNPSFTQTMLPHFVIIMKFIFIVYVLRYQNQRLGLAYFMLSVLYFTLTVEVLNLPLTKALERMELDILEGMEVHYINAGLLLAEVIFSLIFMCWGLVIGQQVVVALAIYTNVVTRLRELLRNTVQAAVSDWSLLADFVRATKEELRVLDDVCAICLNRMTKARKTSCKHYFHGHCLRKCLKQKPRCPICSTWVRTV